MESFLIDDVTLADLSRLIQHREVSATEVLETYLSRIAAQDAVHHAFRTVLVDQARREWQAARSLFENVSEPELIDHAIHRMTAAERRYMFLVREARRSGITEDDLGRLLADPPRTRAASDPQRPA